MGLFVKLCIKAFPDLTILAMFSQSNGIMKATTDFLDRKHMKNWPECNVKAWPSVCITSAKMSIREKELDVASTNNT